MSRSRSLLLDSVHRFARAATTAAALALAACAPPTLPTTLPASSPASRGAAEAPSVDVVTALRSDPPLPGEPADAHAWRGLAAPAASVDPHAHHRASPAPSSAPAPAALPAGGSHAH